MFLICIICIFHEILNPLASVGSMDPYSRVPRSPKNKNTCQPTSITTSSGGVGGAGSLNDDTKSPTNEQVLGDVNQLKIN